MWTSEFVYITAAADQREAGERPESRATTTSPHYHRHGTAGFWSSRILKLLSDVNIMIISQLRTSQSWKFYLRTMNEENCSVGRRETSQNLMVWQEGGRNVMGLTEGLEALNLLICTHHTARSDLHSQTTSETCLSINQKLKLKISLSHFR